MIDRVGHRTVVHTDPEICLHSPMLIKPRPRPQVIRDVTDPKARTGKFFVRNIYEGLPNVEPGEVKWLRVIEETSRTSKQPAGGNPYNQTFLVSSALAFSVKTFLGVVPVEEDGSAYFEVPANRSIFFQALDENFREIQRERTYMNYQPGEVRSCTGCHGESGHAVSPVSSVAPIALGRPPSIPQPQPCDLVENGGSGLAGQVIHYPTDIQPIFDAKCVSCHGNTDPAGGLKLTGELTLYYNTSYEELARKQLAGPIVSEFTSFLQGDRGNYNGAFLPPKSLGCYKSTMIDLLTDPAHAKNAQDDHCGMLSESELMIVSRWVDSNYQFYGTYYGRHSSHWVNPDPAIPAFEPKDLRRKPTFEEAVSKSAPAWHR
ncbi:hypothetical protein LCGC14_1827510 [marine sediment metagenome]|uniref:Cytochrome c domain-containing protein n=1 Tax=marine sediment metagenome TaxID=412755 RepID=A0A0F9JGK9_9ZZZZ